MEKPYKCLDTKGDKKWQIEMKFTDVNIAIL